MQTEVSYVKRIDYEEEDYDEGKETLRDGVGGNRTLVTWWKEECCGEGTRGSMGDGQEEGSV